MADHHITKSSRRYHPYSIAGASLDYRKNRRELMTQVLPDQFVSNLFSSVEQPQNFVNPFINFDDDGQINNYGNSFELQGDQIGSLQSEWLHDIPEMMPFPFVPTEVCSQVPDMEPFGPFEIYSQVSDPESFVSIGNYSQGSDVDQFLNLFDPHFFLDQNDVPFQLLSSSEYNTSYIENTNLPFLNDNYESQISYNISTVPPPVGLTIPSAGSSTQNHPLYPVISKLLEYRDKLYSCQNIDELLNISMEFHRLIDDLNSSFTIPLDSEIRLIISNLSRQIDELCGKKMEYNNFLIQTNDNLNLPRPDTGFINYYSQPSVPGLSNNSKAIRDQKKKTRQQMDPLATLWFIKYLIDHDLRKPDKNNRNLLSLLTNIPEHDVDRWFIRTNQNYIKLNDKKTAREKLNERAKTTSKQLRRPSSLKACGSSSTRGSPYANATRSRRI
ncbi:3009_t:CDS:2 [Gigaspora margarita]|uniref:3009_t:CDS:1 n=1 Tax=Gigaspora margarita TaxID=4874 RepID=A0ABN7ULZ6_GIGMA|nr:3009_t:CDS:2 [Gigaspora margarita]